MQNKNDIRKYSDMLFLHFDKATHYINDDYELVKLPEVQEEIDNEDTDCFSEISEKYNYDKLKYL